MTAPGPPWRLRGEGLVAVARRGPPGRLPDGARPARGPSFLVAARYSASPVGPYQELAVARPVLLGRRPGLCITTMAVDSAESQSGGRHNWGFPKELATLRWTEPSGGPSLQWEERSIGVRCQLRGPTVPVLAPLCCLQQRDDGPVLVLGALRGRLRPATVEVEVPADCDVDGLAGRHPGFHIAGLNLFVGRARPVHTM